MKQWQKEFIRNLNKPKFKPPAKDNPSVATPLYDTIKYSLDRSSDIKSIFSGQKRSYLYSRFDNPNSKLLEQTISSVLDRPHTLLTPSGLSAISLVLESLSHPQSMLMYFEEAYAPTKSFIKNYLPKWGVDSVSCNIDDHDSITKIFEQHSPDIIIFESPTNPQLKIADIEFLTGLAKKHDCISIMDNTFAGLHQHNQYDIDVMLHSLSKFAGGHADLMGGSLSFHKESIYRDCLETARAKGIYLDPVSSRGFTRSLQTYSMRYHAYNKGALKLAKMMEDNLNLPHLVYPGLKSHPEFELAKKQQISPGSVIYFDLSENLEVFDFIDRLEHIAISPSLGSNESVIAPALYFYASDMTEQQRSSANISEKSLRLSVGLEDPEVLYKDIFSALKDD